jgi:exopolysaccharide biosynthesis predicted pyruvyltransferase EpsI
LSFNLAFQPIKDAMVSSFVSLLPSAVICWRRKATRNRGASSLSFSFSSIERLSILILSSLLKIKEISAYHSGSVLISSLNYWIKTYNFVSK